MNMYMSIQGHFPPAGIWRYLLPAGCSFCCTHNFARLIVTPPNTQNTRVCSANSLGDHTLWSYDATVNHIIYGSSNAENNNLNSKSSIYITRKAIYSFPPQPPLPHRCLLRGVVDEGDGLALFVVEGHCRQVTPSFSIGCVVDTQPNR